ncbi:MAG: sel1 repeat family protein [Proteobacteria bacterium]|nr:sel1 repeat family protein [Pseudomonadota bacterium]
MLFVLLALCLTVNTSTAADDDREEGAGFFHYLPAPDIRLPKLDIIPFWTDDLKKARKAYNKGDFGRALKLFRRQSEDGNAVADWYLGHMYRLGRGVSPDPAVAYSYYQRVSENYDPDEQDGMRLRIMVDSQLRLADYTRVGIPTAGLKADPARAARMYLRIAATYGHPAAQLALGQMNILGQGVKKNPQQGLKWLTAAARKRHPGAQAYLGELYWNGTVVQKDHTRALMWYILASQTARPAEDRDIIDRYQEMLWSSDEDMRLEAEARARVYADQYPASLNKD